MGESAEDKRIKRFFRVIGSWGRVTPNQIRNDDRLKDRWKEAHKKVAEDRNNNKYLQKKYALITGGNSVYDIWCCRRYLSDLKNRLPALAAFLCIDEIIIRNAEAFFDSEVENERKTDTSINVDEFVCKKIEQKLDEGWEKVIKEESIERDGGIVDRGKTIPATPQTTLVILLGAHEYPKWRELESDSFRRSAEEIKAYFTDDCGFQLPEKNMLYLFDEPAGPPGILRHISEFLENRTKHPGQSGTPVRDVLVYHIGHGGFVSGDSEYYIALRGTEEHSLKDSSLRISKLSGALKEYARFVRLLFILDCCYAGAALPHFQSLHIADALVRKTEESFPEKGITLLCAASRSTPAAIDEHRGYTMFTGALLEVLKHGDPDGGLRMSPFHIGELVGATLKKRYQGEAARPEVHTPSQKQGAAPAVPLFPNPAANREAQPPFLESIFSSFGTNQTVLLFSQEGMSQSTHHLLSEAQSRYETNNVIHLEPLSGDAVQPAEYFADLFNQCRLPETTAGGVAFRKCIEKRADESRHLLLFITRFEHGNPECGIELANILRSLTERRSNLHILIMGGERLADLYYTPGQPLSLLKGAHPLYWDELQWDDIRFLWPEATLSDATSKMLLDVSGGHPLLLQVCIQHLRKYPDLDASGLRELVKRCDYLWSRFLNLAADESAKQRLRTLLQQQIVSPYIPLTILKDSMNRKLFWNNLIRRSDDGKQLVWRSESIRETGQMVCDYV